MILSLDLDYFNPFIQTLEQEEKLRASLISLFLSARKKGIPVTAYTNHHQILPLVNQCKTRTLINYDSHSDLMMERYVWEDGNDGLNCGTWVSFVKWRNEGEYRWVHALRGVQAGCCNNGGKAPYLFPLTPKRLAEIGWKTVSHQRKREVPPDLNYEQIFFIKSDHYTDPHLYSTFNEVVKKTGIRFFRQKPVS